MKHPKTAQRLRQALGEREITQQELATRTGIGKASISQYINGRHTMSNKNADIIGKVLGVNPLWLMEFEVDKNEPFITDRYTITVSEQEKLLVDVYRRSDHTTRQIIERILNIKED